MTVLLAGDIGGTKTYLRLARAEPAAEAGAREAGPPAALTVLAEERYRSTEDPDLTPIVRRFLTSAAAELGGEPRPAGACFGIAGPVVGDTCEVTNLGWSLSAPRLEHELGIPEVWLINDFAAIGHGVLGLGGAALHTLQPGRPDAAAPIAVLGAGTGLGEGFLIPEPGRKAGPRIFGSEGGHVGFAPRSELELELLHYLQQALNLTHVSVERVVSGQGITWIYEFLRRRSAGPRYAGAHESPAMATVFNTWKAEIGGDPPTGRRAKTVDLAAEVSRAAIAGDPLSEQAMTLFLEAYGAEAGNLALKLLPYGGLYIAGGIAAKNLPLIKRGGLLVAFRDKGRMRPHLERVPLHVVLDPRVGLLGAALYAARRVR